MDLEPGQGITWNSKAGFFSEAGSNLFPGSYSFPFKIPPTKKNMRLLDYPNRLEIEAGLFEEGRVDVYYEGIFLFRADLYVRKGGNQACEGFIVQNEVARFEDDLLSAEDFGPPISLGADVTAALATAKDTAVNPNSYDYVFFPIRNTGFFPADAGGAPFQGSFQNYYDQTSQQFYMSQVHQAATPFLKLHFIMEKIFTGRGYVYDDQVFTNDELKSIMVYNNRSIYDSLTTWALSFKPGDHVPDLTTREFVKQVFKAFAIIPVFSIIDNQVTLKSGQQIADAPVAKDWTVYANPNWTSQNPEGAVEGLCYELDPEDTHNEAPAFQNEDFEVLGEFQNRGLVPSPQAGERYYIWSTGTIDEYDGSSWSVVANGMRCYKVGASEKYLEVEAQPIANTVMKYPEVAVHGKNIFEDIDKPHEFLRLTIYRGMQTVDGQLYPYANSINYDQAGIRIGDYSLDWAGPYGVYEKFWKGWRQVLGSKLEVTMDLVLPIKEVLTFDHSQKIRIANQNYFIKALKCTMKSGKFVMCSVQMLRVL